MQWPDILQPVHIVLFQLLIDPACAIVFEAETAETGVMNRPPRAISSSPFSVNNLSYALIQGAGIALILLTGYALLKHYGWEEGDLRISLFTALIPTVFLLVLANRDSRFVFKGNQWILPMFGGVSLILAAVLFIPFLRDMLRFSYVTPPPMLAAFALLVISALWLKILASIHIIIEKRWQPTS
jgi:Ca2+-transporting ATPase